MLLFLSSLPASATEDTVRTRVIKSLPGVDPTSLRSIVHVAKSRYVPDFPPFSSAFHLTVVNFRCAFVNFKDRVSAERVAEVWANGLDMDGERLGVRWGRSKNTSAATPATPTAVRAVMSGVATHISRSDRLSCIFIAACFQNRVRIKSRNMNDMEYYDGTQKTPNDYSSEPGREWFDACCPRR
jgi:hypothetical protein